MLVWNGNGHPDKVKLASKGKLLLSEKVSVSEAGLTDFCVVEIVTK